MTSKDSYSYPKGVSIIVPALNEAGNIKTLIRRIHSTCFDAGIPYEIIVIDDRSKDETKQIIQSLGTVYKTRVYSKVGKQGKARSLLEGFSYARYGYFCIIDADLQYPPEAIPEMVSQIDAGLADIVVANRTEKKTGLVRRVTSQGYRTVFGKYLFGLNADIQSGLKVFRAEILHWVDLKPSAWAFDLEFLVKSRDRGFAISSVDIVFKERYSGKAKVKLFSTIYELIITALKLKINQIDTIPFRDETVLRHGSGFYLQGKKFVTHNYLHHSEMAVHLLNRRQKLQAAGAIIAWGSFFYFNWHLAVVSLVSFLMVLYFIDLLFNFFLVYKSFFKSVEIQVIESEISSFSSEWPKYTIFCPLYKEWRVLPQFIRAISQLDYPKDKLEVFLLLEEDDFKTRGIIATMSLPSYFVVKVVTNSQPKTKPKACNYGLTAATGEYAVIYDAEDIPDRLQLKKAVIAFSKVAREVACIQAKLNYYNPEQNLITRLFTLEYSLWFDLVLTGLQSIHAPIPLGGTSNHFRTEDLRDFEGWDPFNVTEDADLGMRIARTGFKTAILDSTTMEEANSQFINWFRQRSRWVKGYIQTYLVHTRDPRKFISKQRGFNLLIFQLVIGGKVLSLIINPIMWLLTIIFFAFQDRFGPNIQSFFVTPVFYVGVFTLAIGNFLYLYYYVIGAAKRGRWELIPYSLFVPLYWIMMSSAAYYAIWDLLVRPFHWHKTQHGLHLNEKEQYQNAEVLLQDNG